LPSWLVWTASTKRIDNKLSSNAELVVLLGAAVYALTETIEKLIGPLYGRSINAMAHCPLHEDRTPSLSIHQEEGVWLCHQCGAKGGIENLARIVGEELSPDFYWDRAIAKVKEVPPVEHNFAPLANSLYNRGLAGDGDRAIRHFLAKRGIGIDARHHFYLGWDGNRIAFPYWDDEARKQGKVTAIKYRDRSGAKSMEAGSKRSIYNVEEIRGVASVVICEGETDTMLAWSLLRERGVCGIPGASVSRSQWEVWALDFLWASDIVVAYDADEAGDKGAALAVEVLGDKARRVRPAEGLDLSEHYKQYGRLPDGLAV
jgi:hypothetical protein